MVKKSFLFLFAFLLVFLSSPISTKAEESSYNLYINGKKFDYNYPPIVQNNAIYVPMYGVLSELGINPQWDKDYRTFRINTNSSVVFLKTDSPIILKTELNVANFDSADKSYGPYRDFKRELLTLDFYPISSRDVVYVPLVFLSEYLHLVIAWGENGKISISGGNYTPEEHLKELYSAWNEQFKKIGNSYSNYWFSYNYNDFKSRYYAMSSAPYDLAQYAELGQFLNKDIWLNKTSTFWKDRSLDLPNLTKVKITYVGDGSMLVNDGNYDYTVNTHTIKSLSHASPLSGFFLRSPFDVFDFPQKAWDAIAAQKVYRGMNYGMVLLSWGNPIRTNVTTGKYGTMSQWVYGDSTFLYFEGDVLSTIQY
ncbi:copper amine oxidase N-terminal domain-containing protein [Paenibacillus sp. HWE-109]|uniref:stalk domain-containing protein n=1 Tax=Paenibacillus sp. HWE-109 TaxID=1306526 RepID=UPI001EE09C86|nr:stalk domain-containing protein [Paenibacillus sp. HWE-109]UKS28465.1 copper amine oxidase N-terminal domain-containing protein [Paenibacillus sp. HWE-109]